MIAGPSRPKKSLRNNDNPKKSLKKRKRGAEDDDEDDKGDMGADSDVSGFEEVGEGVSFANDLNDDLDEDEEDFIRTAMEKKNIKDGAKVVKGRKDLKGKKGVSGGGSFQSLGGHIKAILLQLRADKLQILMYRPPSIATSCTPVAGVYDSDTHPTSRPPTHPFLTTSRLRRDGPNRIREDARISCTFGSKTGRESLSDFRGEGPRVGSHKRVGSPDFESWKGPGPRLQRREKGHFGGGRFGYGQG